MTGNIKIHSATSCLMTGSIVFETNFTRQKYELKIADGMTLKNLLTDEVEKVNRDQVLAIIRQGDDAMWDWKSFIAVWQGFAAASSNDIIHNMNVLLRQLAHNLCFINISELNISERKSAQRLKEAGYLKIVDREGENEYNPNW